MEGDKTADNEKELTSTSSSDMGKLLSTNEEEKNELNDTLPTSSTDASTSIKSSHLVSDDPISSTSSEMDTTKAKVAKKTTGDVLDKNLETEEELLEMSMAAQPIEKIEENVDDLVSDLETLLGESIEPSTLALKAEDSNQTDETSRIGELEEICSDKTENEVSSNTGVTDLKKVNDDDVEKEKTTTEVEEAAKTVELSGDTQSSTIDNKTINLSQTVVQDEQSRQEVNKISDDNLNENISDDKRTAEEIVSENVDHCNDSIIQKDSSKLEDIASEKSEETEVSKDIEYNNDSTIQEGSSTLEKIASEKSESEDGKDIECNKETVIQQGSSELETIASEKSDMDYSKDSMAEEGSSKKEETALEKSETGDDKDIDYSEENMIQKSSSDLEIIASEKSETEDGKDIEYNKESIIQRDFSELEKIASDKSKTEDGDDNIENNKCSITHEDVGKQENNVPEISLTNEEDSKDIEFVKDSMTQESSSELEKTLPVKSLEAEDSKDIEYNKNSMIQEPKLEEIAIERSVETVASDVEDSKQILSPSSQEIPGNLPKEESSKEELFKESKEIKEITLDVPIENIESVQTEENSMEITGHNADGKLNEALADVTIKHHSIEVSEKLSKEVLQSADPDQCSSETIEQTVKEKEESLEVEKDSQNNTDQKEDDDLQITEENVDSESSHQRTTVVPNNSDVSKDPDELNLCITKDSSDLEKKTELEGTESLNVRDQEDTNSAKENQKMEEEAEPNVAKVNSLPLQDSEQPEEQKEKDGFDTVECISDQSENQNGQPMEVIERDNKLEDKPVDTAQDGSKDEKSASSPTEQFSEISGVINQKEIEKESRNITESSTIHESKKIELEAPEIESTQEFTSDNLETSTQAGPSKDTVQGSPMIKEADEKLQESPMMKEADEKLQDISENAPEEVEITELTDSSMPIEEAEIVELEPVVEEPDEQIQSSSTVVNEEETIITEVKKEDKLPVIPEEIEDKGTENENIEKMDLDAPSEIKVAKDSDKISVKDQEVKELLGDNINITENVINQEKLTDYNVKETTDEGQKENVEQSEDDKCPENESNNGEAEDIEKDVSQSNMEVESRNVVQDDQICSNVNEMEASEEVGSNNKSRETKQKENMNDISKESNNEGCSMPASDMKEQSEVVHASMANEIKDTDRDSKESLVQTKDSEKEQQNCESQSEEKENISVDQDESNNKTTHSQDISESQASKYIEDVSDNIKDEVKPEIANEKPIKEMSSTKMEVQGQKLEEIIHEVHDAEIKEDEKRKEKVVENVQEIKPTPEINIRRKTVEQDLEKVVCLSEESSDSDTNEEVIKSLQKTENYKELDCELDTLIHNVPSADELPSNSVENDLIKIAREVEQLQNIESNDPIESEESMPGIEDILSDQPQEILNEIPVDTAENLETILAVASLQNEPVPEIKVERRLSEKELREMEAIRMAVASITDSSQDTYDSYLVESSITMENSIPEVSSDVQELSSDTQEPMSDVQELSSDTQSQAEAVVENSFINSENAETTQETEGAIEKEIKTEEIVKEQNTDSISKDADKSNSDQTESNIRDKQNDETDNQNNSTKLDICRLQKANAEAENIQDITAIEDITEKTIDPVQEKDNENTVIISEEIKENDTVVTSEEIKEKEVLKCEPENTYISPKESDGQSKEKLIDNIETENKVLVPETVQKKELSTDHPVTEKKKASDSKEIVEENRVTLGHEEKKKELSSDHPVIEKKKASNSKDIVEENRVTLGHEEKKKELSSDNPVTEEEKASNSKEIVEENRVTLGHEGKKKELSSDHPVTEEKKASDSKEIVEENRVSLGHEEQKKELSSDHPVTEKKKASDSKEIVEENTVTLGHEEKKKELSSNHPVTEKKKASDSKEIVEENTATLGHEEKKKELSSDHPVTEKKKASDLKEIVEENRKIVGHEEKKVKASEQKASAPVQINEENKSEHVVEEDNVPSSEKNTEERIVLSSDQATEVVENKAVPQVVEERSLRNRARRGNKVIEPLSISVEENEKKDKPYSPKVTIKPVKVPDEEVSTTSDAEGNKGSLKITITKQSDKMHSILKVYDPEDEPEQPPVQGEPIPKLIIKPKMQQVEQQVSPKMSTRSTKVYSPTSTQRCSSPRVTIKPVVKPTESKNEAHSPLKITFKPVVKPDEGNKRHSPKTSKEQEQKNSNPKITIKPIPKPAETEKEETSISTPKVTIKPLKRPHEDTETENEPEKSSPKITIKPVLKPVDQEVDHSNQTTPKLKIKPIRKHEDEENNMNEKDRDSPKISIKPIVKPAEIEDEEEVKERIVLKINKGNLPTPSKDSRKREYPEDEKTEKMGKLKLKFSTMGGQTHIVQEGDEGNKRQRKDSGYSGKKDEELSNKRASEEKIPDKNKRLRSSITPDKGHVESSEGNKIHDQKLDSPIVISEDSRSQHSTDGVVVENTPDISKISDIASRTTHIEATPIVTVGVVTPSVSPAPKKRGRPRKVPLEVREELKDPPTTPQVTPQTTPQSTPVADVSSVSSDKSEPGTPTATPSPLGRPKRSCRGQNVIATLGIKPRKPRGGGKGRGSKVNMGDREPVVVTTPVEPIQTVSMKPEKVKNKSKKKKKKSRRRSKSS